jgi:N-acyl homoserine lactone hydrolase
MPITIHILKCGDVIVDEALPFSDKGTSRYSFTGIFRSNKHKVTLPVFAFLIEHPKGLFLVDTGWHTDIRGGSFKYLGAALSTINTGVLNPGEAVTEQLDGLGYKPEDLDCVLLTHLDCDHVSGLKLVAGAKRILVSRNELGSVSKEPLRYTPKQWEGTNLEVFDFEDSEIGPFKKSHDFLGDGSLNLVWTPGHSAGMVSVLLRSDGESAVIAGDCGYGPRSWKEGIMPGICKNPEVMGKSLAWLKGLDEDPNCKGIFASHDSTCTVSSLTI